MRFLYCYIFIYIHILKIANSVIPTLPLKTGTGGNIGGELLESLRTINIMDLSSTHKYSGTNPRENFIKLELAFIINMGIRIETLLNTYKNIINENIKKGYDQLEEKINELTNKWGEELKEYVDGLNTELKEIVKEYDSVDYKPKIKDHKSFSNEEIIRSSMELVRESYDIIKKHIENSELEEGLKSKLVWTVKNKTVLMGLSIKVMLVKMMSDYTYLKKVNLHLIGTGIYYILVFESGINKRIVDTKLEEKMEYFNTFLENYESSVEELIQRIILQVKERELILKLEERTYRDLEMAHKQFEGLINPVITLSGAVIKKVEL